MSRRVSAESLLPAWAAMLLVGGILTGCMGAAAPGADPGSTTSAESTMPQGYAGAGATLEGATQDYDEISAEGRRGRAVPVTTAASPELSLKRASLPTPGRKIIDAAELALTVKRLDSIAGHIRELVKSTGGYLDQEEIGGDSRERRTGRWVVRLPVERFESFLASMAGIGEMRRVSRDAQDVTEEFVDVAARLKARRLDEERILRHLRVSTATLRDILSVEREQNRLHEEIERIEGRLRLVADQAALSTVTIGATEARNYLPAERTTFTARLRRTLLSSVGGMGEAAEGAVLLVVALSPWVALLALPLATTVVILRCSRVRSPGPTA